MIEAIALQVKPLLRNDWSAAKCEASTLSSGTRSPPTSRPATNCLAQLSISCLSMEAE
jgi:hypothetical protein